MKRHLPFAAAILLAAPIVHGDHYVEHAKRLTHNVQLQATITGDAYEYYRFDLDGAARVEVRSGGSEDAFGILYDGALNEIAQDDDGGTNLNFSIVADLSPGPHYVRVGLVDGGGDYGIIWRVLREGDDHGDTHLSSTRIEPNVRTAGRIVPADDVDVFRIDIDRAVTATIATSGAADTRGRLARSDGGLVAAADHGGSRDNFSMVEALSPGVYYLHVAAEAQGAYGVQYSVPEEATTAGPPPVEAASLLGAWFGNFRLLAIWWLPDFMVFDRLETEPDGTRYAVEPDFTVAAFLDDADESFHVGFTTDDLGLFAAEGFDYVVINRAYDINCTAYLFSLTTPSADTGTSLYVSGGMDDTLACIWDGAGIYDAVVARGIEAGHPLLATGEGFTREMAVARQQALRNAQPVGYRPDVVAALQALPMPGR